MELFATPDNPVPPGAITAPALADDGVALRVARWSAPGLARGTVCVLPGRGEFIEKYFEVVTELVRRRFTVVVVDWRGQGLSGRPLRNPRKGHVDDFALFERDLAAVTRQVLQSFCPRPWFALGHSMGGAILLAQAQAGRSPFARIVATAPMLDLHGLRLPRAVRAVIEIADLLGLGGAFVPGGGPASAMSAPFENNTLTSDPRRHARNARIVSFHPQLALGDPTVGWLNAAFRLMARFNDAAGDAPPRSDAPVLAFAAGEDRIVSSPAIHRYVGGLRTGLAVTIPRARHEILQEADPIREQFWAAFDAFIPGQLAEKRALDQASLAQADADAQAGGLRSLLRKVAGSTAER